MRAHTWIMLVTLTACIPEQPEKVQAFSYQDGEYDIAAREIPWMTDAQRLDGELGTGKRGGQILIAEYVGGGPLDIPYVVDDDGVGWPEDEDGLVLWSFYAHLGDAREQLTDQGYDMAPLFPVGIAHTPSQALLDFSSFENAAYVTGGAHLFVLLKDLIDKDVPLAANAGIVRHEFGHAWFQVLTAGDAHTEPPYLYEDTPTTNAVRALNEGFADMVATLSLDDPAFIEDSLPLPERDVSAAHIASDALYPDPDGDALSALEYDPYPLGSCYAAVAWDLREATSPEYALQAVITAVEDWSLGATWSQPDQFLHTLADAVADDADALEAVCDAVTTRFPDVTTPQECP